MIPWYSLLPVWLWNIIELFLFNYFLAMLARTVSFLSFEYMFPFILVVAIRSLFNDYLQEERRLTFGHPAIHIGVAAVLVYLTGKFMDVLDMEEIKPENGSHLRNYKFTSINQELSFFAAVYSVFVFLIRIDYYLVLITCNSLTKSDESVRGLETSPINRYPRKNNNFLNGERKRIYCE